MSFFPSSQYIQNAEHKNLTISSSPLEILFRILTTSMLTGILFSVALLLIIFAFPWTPNLMVLFAVLLHAILCLVYFHDISLPAFIAQFLILDSRDLHDFASKKKRPKPNLFP